MDGLDFYDDLKESLPSATSEVAVQVAELKKDKNVARLIDVKKKTVALEQKKTRGKKVAKTNVAALKKSLEPCLKSADESVKTAAANLSSRLDSLAK